MGTEAKKMKSGISTVCKVRRSAFAIKSHQSSYIWIVRMAFWLGIFTVTET